MAFLWTPDLRIVLRYRDHQGLAAGTPKVACLRPARNSKLSTRNILLKSECENFFLARFRICIQWVEGSVDCIIVRILLKIIFWLFYGRWGGVSPRADRHSENALVLAARAAASAAFSSSLSSSAALRPPADFKRYFTAREASRPCRL